MRTLRYASAPTGGDKNPGRRLPRPVRSAKEPPVSTNRRPAMPPAKSTGSQLERALASGRFVITAEVTPPVSCDPQELLVKAMPLKEVADAVNVTDGAGARAHLGALAAATILNQNGIEPVLQLTCRAPVSYTHLTLPTSD